MPVKLKKKNKSKTKKKKNNKRSLLFRGEQKYSVLGSLVVKVRRVVRVPDDAFRSVHVIHHFFALRDVGIRLGG